MCAKQKISTITNSGPNIAAEGFAAGQRFEIRHTPVIDSIGASRIKFERRKPLCNTLRGSFGTGLRVIVKVSSVGVLWRLEICIGAQPFIHLAAKQRMHRPVQRLADNIPAGHFKTADDALNRGIRPVAET